MTKSKKTDLDFSVIVFQQLHYLEIFKLDIHLGFDVHNFAMANAFINTAIAILLLAALISVRMQKYAVHKKLMLSALVLSILFWFLI